MVAALSLGYSGTAGLYVSATGWLPELIEGYRPINFFAIFRLGQLQQDLQRAQAAEDEALRAKTPLPQLTGATDIYSYDQAIVFAHRYPYQPRPVIQSYAAYTPELAAMNAAHLRSARAARNVIFRIAPIDGRFPALEDGLSWPELLTRYDLRAVTDRFAILEKSDAPRSYQLRPVRRQLVRFGEVVGLSVRSEFPVWVEFGIRPTLAGRMASVLHKPPVLMIKVTTESGRASEHRLVPGMAKAGFLLSPLINDHLDFAALAIADRSKLDRERVATFELAIGNGFSPEAMYEPSVALSVYELVFPAQKFRSLADTPSEPAEPR
jgi:hypothetical protein